MPPAGGRAAERCSFSVARGLSADGSGVTLSWFPAGGRAVTAEVATFDATGRRIVPAELELRPARFLVTSLVPPNVAIDLVGDALADTPHPPRGRRVGRLRRGELRARGGAIVVRAVRNLGQTLAVRARLAPHVFFAKGDAVDAAPSFQVAVLPAR